MHKRIGTALVLVLMAVMATASAQNCRDDIAASAPDSRYRDNGDGTVSDLATGLIWKQCAEGLSGTACESGSALGLIWQDALQRAADAEFAGSALWRLPNSKELASLVEERCTVLAINSRFFPNTPSSTASSWFWTSSPYAYGSVYAWGVNFSYGYVNDYVKGTQAYVRLVRGGQ